jgi:hypothetical protein
VKKLISILLALGVLLSLGVMATPASADVTAATVSPVTNCAGDTATYTITFDVTADLLEGDGTITIDFPDDTDVSAISITVTNGAFTDEAVPPAWITTAAGAVVTFYVPMHIVVAEDPTVIVKIAGVVNPSAGTKTLTVNTSAPVDSTPVASTPYVIAPAISTIVMTLDFSPTYAGLAEDFIPPFKACGQECYGYEDMTVGWMTEFDLTVAENPPGCEPPCDDADFWFVLTACEPGGVVTLDWDNTGTPVQYTLDDTDVGDVQSLGTIDLTALPTTFSNGIHFSIPGDYEICWYIECPAVPCTAGKQIVATKCLPAKVYQWKDAQCIPLWRKWNLISLPLVPLEDQSIEDMLDACAFKDQIMSIWYYDRCEDYPNGQWYVWPTPDETQEALTALEDGKSYWVRTVYNSAHPAGEYIGPLWTWGTPQPTPPASPSAYAVCEGWNMVGLTGYCKWWYHPSCPCSGCMWGSTIEDEDYLWNWFDDGMPEYGGIYGWDPDGCFGGPGPQAWWSALPKTATLPRYYTGEGYWISFEHDGTIYPP